MTAPRLRALLALAEARKAEGLAALERLLAEDHALAEEAGALAATHARDLAEGPAPLPVLEARLRWAEARAAAIRAARAALAPRIAVARARAVEALGKREALDRLANRAEAEARARREARAEAPPRQGGAEAENGPDPGVYHA